jgi:hypothetical protein
LLAAVNSCPSASRLGSVRLRLYRVPEHFTPRMRRADLPQDADPRLRRAADELWELGDAYERTGDDSSGQAEIWKRRADVLAASSAILAAGSGVVGLALDSRVIAALLALAAAVVSALLASLRPADKASERRSYADACWEISGEVRDLLTRVPDMTVQQAQVALIGLRQKGQRVSRQSLGIGPNPAT